MTNIDEGALSRLADAVHKAHDPRARAIDHFAESVSAVFSEAAKRDGANLELHLRIADGLARHRELRGRMESRYDLPAMFDRLQSRGGMAALWC